MIALLRGKTQSAPSRLTQLLQPLTTAIRGSTAQDVLEALALLASGDAALARKKLMELPGKGLPPEFGMIRWQYIGVASARLDDMPAALEAWKQIKRFDQAQIAFSAEQRYRHGFAAAIIKQSLTLLESGDPAAGLRLALEGSQMVPESLHLTDIVLAESNRHARTAAAAGDWAKARQHWTNALRASTLEKTTGGSTASFTYPALVVRSQSHNLALACEALGDWLAAANAWRQMLRTKPRKNSRDAKTDPMTEAHWAWVRKHVIACYKQAGDLKQAITICRQALKAQPDDAELQLDLAEALLANEQMGAGMSELQKLIAKYPQHVEALTLQAQIYSARHEWQSAEQTLLKALQVEPNNPKVREHMADVLMDSGNFYAEREIFDLASDLFERALPFAPTNYNIQLCLARVDFNRNKPQSAREHLEQALTLGKNKSDAYVQAFACWVTESELASARGVLSRAETNGQMTAAVCVGAGATCLHRAAPIARENPMDLILGLTRKPKKPARAKAALDEYTVFGRELFDRAMKLGPETDVIHSIIDSCGPGHYPVLLPYIRRLTELTPEDTSAWMIFGIALGSDQQTAEAQKALREAAQLARKQGKHDVAKQADEMRKMISDPMFSLLMQTMPFMDDLGEMSMGDPYDDFNDDDAGPGDFLDFLRPVRRKRRKR